MPESESDPSQSTEMFRAFVERGAAEQRTGTRERRVPTAAIVAIVVVVVVLAVAAWLLS